MNTSSFVLGRYDSAKYKHCMHPSLCFWMNYASVKGQCGGMLTCSHVWLPSASQLMAPSACIASDDAYRTPNPCCSWQA